ncbi:glycosyltransferase [Zeimonas arvi]|uniref:Glycosyltransferase n=1 Tax=Zeimonas arvi TaxID=2498847 RepID=A0A5C8NXW0_9BURK|nr:glycosyltransferase [Zeimonas arvi]TXL65951.1 glycosyltransferase [Zeimonas arvi]
MKIGFLYGQSVSRATSGGSVHGFQLSRRLHELGNDLCSFYVGEDFDPLVRHYRGRQIFSFLRDLGCIYLRVEWAGGPERFSPIKLLSIRKIPVVWELNGTSIELLYSGRTASTVRNVNLRLRKLAPFADAAIAVSQEIADYAASTLGLKNVHVVPNGSDPLLFRPSESRMANGRGPLSVAWVGTTAAGWHDIDSMLQCARILAQKMSPVVIHIFGDPTHLPKGLPSNVIARGVVPYAQLGSELGKLDAGIHIFRADLRGQVEGSPLKIFDYMASGLAVITQPEGQRRDIIHRWTAGIPTTGTPEDLARAISILESNRQWCHELGQNGRNAVVSFYNWDRAARQTNALLRSLTTDPRDK